MHGALVYEVVVQINFRPIVMSLTHTEITASNPTLCACGRPIVISVHNTENHSFCICPISSVSLSGVASFCVDLRSGRIHSFKRYRYLLTTSKS